MTLIFLENVVFSRNKKTNLRNKIEFLKKNDLFK